MTPVLTAVFCLEAVLALVLLWHEKLINNVKQLILPLLMLALIGLVRFSLLDFESRDYLDFLAPWTQFFRENGGFATM